MITTLVGDILDADAIALVNPVNCVGVMGAGLALQFKNAFPAMFQAYQAQCATKSLAPGRLHVYDRGPETQPRYIINFPTKRHWKDRSSLVDIKVGLDALVAELVGRGITSVAIPPLGCGLGGLDWNEVRPRIEQALEQVHEIDARIYLPTRR